MEIDKNLWRRADGGIHPLYDPSIPVRTQHFRATSIPRIAILIIKAFELYPRNVITGYLCPGFILFIVAVPANCVCF